MPKIIPKGPQGIRYTDKQKNDALQSFIVFGGNMAMTSAACGISETTLYQFTKTEWWKEAIQELKSQERMELSARLKRVIAKSWDVVEDRLKHGDFVLNNKTGGIIRKPVSMKEASRAAVDSVVLREKLEKQEAYTVHADQVEDKLAKLAKAFSDLAKGVKPKEEPEDIEFVEEIKENEDDLSGNSVHRDAGREDEEEGLSDLSEHISGT